jgi:hypothetical protein
MRQSSASNVLPIDTPRHSDPRTPRGEGCVNVNAHRLLDIFSLMERFDRDSPDGFALCSVAAEFMALDGAIIALTNKGDALTSLCTSNVAAGALMDLENTLGEGPTMDASRGDAIEDFDLLRTTTTNWSTYRPEAAALGARAVFGYPVRLGAIRFGALTLFRYVPGPLSANQSLDAYLMASVIGRAILTIQAGGSPNRLVGELSSESPLNFRVHQAAGMLAVQASMSVKDALVFLQAHAFGTGCQLTDLAQRVVSRSTCFAPETQEWVDQSAEGGK